MPPIQPSQQAPIGYQYRGFQQTPSYPSGMSSSHSSNSELSRIAQSATPTFPVSTPEPQFTNPVYQQAQQGTAHVCTAYVTTFQFRINHRHNQFIKQSFPRKVLLNYLLVID